jgi:hypothetical protein
MMMFPKPAKPTRGTAEARRYMDAVAQLPCVCCRRYAVQAHHVIHGRFARRKASDIDTIPLCHEHHDELHMHPDRWRNRYGLDTDYLGATRLAVDQLRNRTIGGRT